MPKPRRAVENWSLIALLAECSVKVPFGLALLALAAYIIWWWGNIPLFDILALYLAYHGGNYAFGSLAGFTHGSKDPRAPKR
jgi:hypothetical protein